MPSAFSSPMPIKLASASFLLVPSVLLSMISLLSEFSINPIDYEIFDDSEELSESKIVTLQ